MLRPQACRWFELIAVRHDVASVLETLARTGAVELQTHESTAPPLVIAGDEATLAHVHELAKTYHAFWPEPAGGEPMRLADPAQRLATRVASLEAWRKQADPLITEIERLGALQRNLADLTHLLAAGPARLPGPELLVPSGRLLIDSRIYAVVARAAASDLPPTTLQLTLPGVDGEDYVVVVGRREDMPRVDDTLAARRARRVDWPDDLRGDLAHAARDVAARRADAGQRRTTLEHELDALAQRHDLAGALADIALIEWLIRHGAELAASDRLLWVTGWTTTRDSAAFSAPLQQRGLHCVVQFPPPPAGAEPPSQLVNPRAIRAFESFARLLGQPGRDEADPSVVVAVVAPLLFGFMFGDLGQGAVLCLAGWWLRRRVPMLVMLVPGGIAAMLFGVLFGSVFARDDLLPALWLHPLREPVTLLAVAVGIGAAILLGGLLLDALQAHWRREAALWWQRDVALLAAYLALLAALQWPKAAWGAPAAVLWLVVGAAFGASGRRAAAVGSAVAQFVEKGFQLLVNTVSFARVGAFALAHAGLSAAVVGVAEAAGTLGYWIVLVCGNVLIVVLEGLVVGIQTTRLLLFEFFVRFLKGSGRVFRPLPPPRIHFSPTPRSTP